MEIQKIIPMIASFSKNSSFNDRKQKCLSERYSSAKNRYHQQKIADDI